jgi:deoxyribodipyrimidine photo-lyase
MTDEFVPTRAAGMARLEQFLPFAGRDYAARRNSDIPGVTSVSHLSPWIRHRLITEQDVIAAVRAEHAPDACLKFVQEVLWRTYWKGWLELRPSVWADYRLGVAAALNRIQTEEGLRRKWQAACLGETGIEGFDHWARELAATGYLHNHARMWFASIWIFTLRLPWELGADFFLRHLLDGDPASNTLSWRWVAGIQTPGKTYLARADNIAAYTGGRFLPKGLATEAMAIKAPPAPPPQSLRLPEPPDPGEASVLLLHEDDLSPGFILTRGVRPIATALLAAADDRSPLSVAPAVANFTYGAMEATAALYRTGLGDVRPLQTQDSAAALVTWAVNTGARQIVTAHAPVGPMATRLRDIEREAGKRGLSFVRCLRDEDSALWPNATHGFFRFWEAVQSW